MCLLCRTRHSRSCTPPLRRSLLRCAPGDISAPATGTSPAGPGDATPPGGAATPQDPRGLFPGPPGGGLCALPGGPEAVRHPGDPGGRPRLLRTGAGHAAAPCHGPDPLRGRAEGVDCRVPTACRRWGRQPAAVRRGLRTGLTQVAAGRPGAARGRLPCRAQSWAQEHRVHRLSVRLRIRYNRHMVPAPSRSQRRQYTRITTMRMRPCVRCSYGGRRARA